MFDNCLACAAGTLSEQRNSQAGHQRLASQSDLLMAKVHGEGEQAWVTQGLRFPSTLVMEGTGNACHPIKGLIPSVPLSCEKCRSQGRQTAVSHRIREGGQSRVSVGA